MKKRYVLKRHTEQERALILRMVAAGNTLAVVVKKLGISRSTVETWARDDDEFREKYRRARESQSLALADLALEVAAKPAKDIVEVKQRELHVKTIMWHTAKTSPRLFAERLQHDHAAHVGVIVLPPLDYSQQPIPALRPEDEVKALPPGES